VRYLELSSWKTAKSAEASVNKADRVLLLALGVSLLANVYQFWSFRQKLTVTHVDAQLMPRAGTKLAELHLLKLEGGAPDLKIGPNELPVVVYILSPTCKWCEMNWPNVNSLAAQLGGKYRFIGASNTSKDLQTYVNAHHPAFPVYYVDPSSAASEIQLNVTPRTLVFSPEGVFLRGWDGIYAGDTKVQLASFFHVVPPA
jgi:hypothetical protein